MLSSLVASSLRRRAATALASDVCSGRLLTSLRATTTSSSSSSSSSSPRSPFSTSSPHATTVLCVRKGDSVVVMADGQVTRGSEVVKPNVKKVRALAGGAAIGGFAGATADAFTLFERLEAQLEAHPGQLTRAAVELAKLWRTDKYLRRLDAVMVVADAKVSLSISGGGDVLEPHDGVLAIGSGSPYALAAARALVDTPLGAREICERAMKIAADACIYTNDNFTIEELKTEEVESGTATAATSTAATTEGSKTAKKEKK